jgi:hypothetical protein
MNPVAAWLGERLAAFLTRPCEGRSAATSDARAVAAALRPGDVLLVEGNTRISRVIKTLTQSNWSHAALCVWVPPDDRTSGWPRLVEADLREGVRELSLTAYAGQHTRICRPVGLAAADLARVLDYVRGRLGQRYDLKNVIDLARYLLPAPPVPRRFRRRMIRLGSGDPTRAICSTLIAQAFQAIRYPILPEVRRVADDPGCADCWNEILYIRHHSLFTPRDFDVSPYFEIVKPALRAGFDYRALRWAEPADADRSGQAHPIRDPRVAVDAAADRRNRPSPGVE